MDDLLSEKEQIEKMRTWWSDYGNYVIAGIVLGAAALFGINYYQGSNLEKLQAASALYDTLADHVAEGELEAAKAVASDMDAQFTDTPYYAQSQLAMARLYMDQNRDQDAADALQSLIDSTASDEEFRNVARVRLAKILLYQGKAEEVLALVEGREDAAFAARYAEVLGDAYVALERFDDARGAYESALAEPGGAATVDQTFVQLKLLDLPFNKDAANDTAAVELDETVEAEESTVENAEASAAEPADEGDAESAEEDGE